MTTKTTTIQVPVIAGHKNEMKLHKVGFDIIRFTFRVYPDGDDSQLIKEQRIKRVITKN